VKNNPKILLAMESAFERDEIKDLLYQLGFHKIIEATDGIKALSRYEKFEVDLIILDWKLPRKSGFDVFKFIRNGRKNKNFPFIFLAPLGNRNIDNRVIDDPESNILEKPVRREIMRKSIRHACKMNMNYLTSVKFSDETKLSTEVEHLIG